MVLLATQLLLITANPTPDLPPGICSTCQPVFQEEEVRASDTFHNF